MTALAIVALLISPPERSDGYSSRRSVIPSLSDPSISLSSEGLSNPPIVKGKRIFSLTVSAERRLSPCGIYLIFWFLIFEISLSPVSFNDLPSIITAPDVGSVRPVRRFKNVVLPLPDSPSIMTKSPGSIVKSISSTARKVFPRLLYSLTSFCASRKAILFSRPHRVICLGMCKT